jgi:hypothetical protein
VIRLINDVLSTAGDEPSTGVIRLYTDLFNTQYQISGIRYLILGIQEQPLKQVNRDKLYY